MLIKNIEKRIKINIKVALATVGFAIIIVICGFFFSYKLIQDSRKSIYIIDNGIPVLVKQTDEMLNRPVEYKAQIDLFHRMFFTLTPDDEHIRTNVKQSLYLIDDTGKKEYQNLIEKGYYNQIVSSNSVVFISTDSIKVDLENKKWIYYGKQFINRKTVFVTRLLITEGKFRDIPRTPNNAHGVLLENWKVLDNRELQASKKY